MSFFGNDLPTNGEFDAGGADFEVMPNNTEVLASADQAEWSEYNNERYINIKWVVLAPDQFKNRVLFQKVKVFEQNPDKAQKAKSMLAAIDYNASGGKLVQSGQEPTDETLSQHLCHAPMYLKLRVWEMEINGEQKSGNWVASVAPKNKQSATQQAAPVANAAPDNGDNIPF